MTRSERSRRDYLIRYNKNPVAEHLKFKKHFCKKYKIPFNLTKKWAGVAYTGKCALTGIEFNLKTKHGPFSPSVDRINNKKGYTVNNSRVVLRGVNCLKGTGTDEDMYKMAYALLTNKKKRDKTNKLNDKKGKNNV